MAVSDCLATISKLMPPADSAFGLVIKPSSLSDCSIIDSSSRFLSLALSRTGHAFPVIPKSGKQHDNCFMMVGTVSLQDPPNYVGLVSSWMRYNNNIIVIIINTNCSDSNSKYVCVRACMHACTYIQTCMHTYISTYIHTHTVIHTHTLIYHIIHTMVVSCREKRGGGG